MKLFVTVLAALLVCSTMAGPVSTARADDPPGTGDDDKPATAKSAKSAKSADPAPPGPGPERADAPGEEADKSTGEEMAKLWASQPHRKLPFRYGYPDAEKNLHLMITQPAEPKP